LSLKKGRLIVEKPSSLKRKIHNQDVSRLGGLVFISLILLLFKIENILTYNFLLFCYVIFLIGIFEDLITNISKYIRLILLIFAILYFTITNSFIINSFENDVLSYLVSSTLIVSLAFTSLGLLICINGFNFIDGLNGLLLGNAVLILSFFAYYSAGISYETTFLCICAIIAIIPLFVINIVEGKVLTGDGGAYFLGSLIGCLSVQMANSGALNEFEVAAIIFYPTMEIIFTGIRRLLRRKNPFKPDSMHLHTLLFLYISENKFLRNKKINTNYINSLSSSIILFFLILLFIIRDLVSSIIHPFVFILFLVLIYCIAYAILSLKHNKIEMKK
tara:strand:+ start:6923 stop:7918 length:996 start_codon:yes stop_codon:yes gene_type:complete